MLALETWQCALDCGFCSHRFACIVHSKLSLVMACFGCSWVQSMTGVDCSNFPEALRSGVLLCTLANVIRPGAIEKINKFRQQMLMLGQSD